MPHVRKRHLFEVFQQTTDYSPIAGLFGHRQVGKTTLISQLSEEYISLDIRSALQLCDADPESFIENRKKPFAIDECQYSADLFPALKECVRKNQRPGQFILSGSVRFSSRKQIRESLVGRLISWELLPMDLSEIHGRPMPNALIKITAASNLDVPLKRNSYCNLANYQKYLKHGGMPGFFSIRNEVLRRQKLETQLEALLERDLRLLLETKLSFEVLKNLITILANEQGEPFEINKIARKSQITVPTLTKLILAFQNMYLIRFLNCEGGTKKKIIYFEDQGEATYFSERSQGSIYDLTRFLFANLRTQLAYQNKFKTKITQYRTRSGAIVPLCISVNENKLGIIPMLEENPNEKHLGSARSFIKSFPSAKILFVHLGKKDMKIHKQMRILPAACLI